MQSFINENFPTDALRQRFYTAADTVNCSYTTGVGTCTCVY